MRTLILVVLATLVILSIIARVQIRRGKGDGNFVSAVLAADTLFLFLGLFLVGLADVGSTNQLAKYQEGFPHVDRGGLPPDLFFGNLLIFALPLFAVGVRWIAREVVKDLRHSLRLPTP